MNKDQSEAHEADPKARPERSARARDRNHDMGLEGPEMDETKRAVGRLRDVGRNLVEQIEVQIHERPYVVLGATLGFGFAAGALFGSRLGQIALALAAGYGLRNVVANEGGDLGDEPRDRVERLVKEGIEKVTQERSKG